MNSFSRSLGLSGTAGSALIIFSTRVFPLAPPRQQQPLPRRSGASVQRENPLLTRSTLPYQAPPFDKIRDTDYAPALDEGMKQELAEVQRIADNPAAPTFENTLVALERSGQLLARVNMDFNALTSANTNPTLQKVQEEAAPKLSATHDAIYLDDKLFKRIQTLYDERAQLKLDPESARLLDCYHQEFILAGAKLSAADKARLKTLNAEVATLSAQFTNRLLAAAKDGALVVHNQSALAGLSPAEVSAAAKAAKDRGLSNAWVIPLQNTTQQPALQSLISRDTRHSCSTPRGRAPSAATPTIRVTSSRASRSSALNRRSCSGSRASLRGSFRIRWRKRPAPSRGSSARSLRRPLLVHARRPRTFRP